MLPDGIVGPYDTRLWEILTSEKKFQENWDNRRLKTDTSGRGSNHSYIYKQRLQHQTTLSLICGFQKQSRWRSRSFCLFVVVVVRLPNNKQWQEDHRDRHQYRVPTSWLGVQFGHSGAVELVFCGWSWESLTSRWQLKQTSHRDASTTWLDFPALHIFKMSRINSLGGFLFFF